MKKIEKMSGRELAPYMGQDATDAQGEAMKTVLCRGGYGKYSPGEISDNVWSAAMYVAIEDANEKG